MPGFTNLVWFMGVVENNVDERLEGRVQVRAFGFHGTTQQISTQNLPWAIPIAGSYDPNYPVPPLNSWVFGFFLDGNEAQQPMLIGLMPTQYINPINPEVNGWGNIDTTDYHAKAMGFRPEDIGQPQRSRLARGESLDQTYIRDTEVTRVSDVASASGETWSEPGPAYNAKYPYNRVIQTAAGHSIELDDTPGAERVMVYHSSGSYIQIDTTGTTTTKSTDDKYDINESNMHLYVGGRCDIAIMGDAYIKVEGSKLEEIMGDCKTIVHGNYDLDVGGYANINVSDEVQLRGARVGLEAKVENVDIMGGKSVNITGNQGANITSPKSVNISGQEGNSIKGQSINIEGGDSINIKSESVKIGGGGSVSIKGSLVAIDDVIQLSNGMSSDPASATDATPALSTKMVEPTSKGVSGITSGVGSSTNRPSGGSGGVASNEDIIESPTATDYTSDCSTDLVEAVARYESFRAKAYWDEKQYSVGYGLKTDNPNEIITEPEAKNRLSARLSNDRAYVATYGRSKGYSWNDCQIDALTSFCYNLGTGVLSQVTNNGTRTNPEIAEAMLQYNGTISNGVKTVLDGLVSRRQSESGWFMSGTTGTTSTEGTLV